MSWADVPVKKIFSPNDASTPLVSLANANSLSVDLLSIFNFPPTRISALNAADAVQRGFQVVQRRVMTQTAQIDLDVRGRSQSGFFIANEHLERTVLGRERQTGVV